MGCKCMYCEEEFGQKEDLVVHLLREHSGPNAPEILESPNSAMNNTNNPQPPEPESPNSSTMEVDNPGSSASTSAVETREIPDSTTNPPEDELESKYLSSDGTLRAIYSSNHEDRHNVPADQFDDYALLYRCLHRYCGSQFFSELELRVHELKHIPDFDSLDELQCKYCNADIQVEDLTEHFSLHYSQAEYSCSKCDLETWDIKEIEQHIQSVHSSLVNVQFPTGQRVRLYKNKDRLVILNEESNK